jgi:hypothetical protein
MRRPIGVLLIAVLTTALSLAPARADSLVSGDYALQAQVFARVFGENTDAKAAVDAASGNRISESPLRELALVPASNVAPVSFVPDLFTAPTFAREVVGSGVAVYTPPQIARTASVPPIASNAPSALTVAAYKPLAPVPIISLQPGTVSFGPGAVSAPARQAPVVSSGFMPALRPAALQVQSHVDSASTQMPAISLRDTSYGAGANFDVHALRRDLNVNVTSSYEQLNRNDVGYSPSLSLWQLPGDDEPLIVPSNANMSRISLGAGVAVPVMKGLTFNLNYDTTRLLGANGLPGLTNLDAIDNAYGGRLTFAIPHSSSTLSFSAYQFRYQDNILPANSLTQTRENVNFTVKF